LRLLVRRVLPCQPGGGYCGWSDVVERIVGTVFQVPVPVPFKHQVVRRLIKTPTQVCVGGWEVDGGRGSVGRQAASDRAWDYSPAETLTVTPQSLR
jgi:hypothetical protein